MQPTNNSLLILAFGFFIILLFLTSIFAWISLIAAKSAGIFRFPVAERRRLAPWGLLDILCTVFIFAFMQIAFTGLTVSLGLETLDSLRPPSTAQETSAALAQGPNVSEEKGKSESQIQLKTNVDKDSTTESGKEPDTETESDSELAAPPTPPATNLRIESSALIHTSGILVLLIATAWIALRCQVPFSRVGWSLREVRRDTWFAIAAIVLFIPIVYLLMALASFGFDREYNHPLFDMVGKNLWLIVFAFWMAVIVAPLTEEFFFRVLLQGYLESMAAGPLTLKEILLGRPNAMHWIAGGELVGTAAHTEAIDVELVEEQRIAQVSALANSSDPVRNPYAIPSFQSSQSDPVQRFDPSGIETAALTWRRGRLPWWPILVTGLLFGLAHFEYGMSWIPLTFLGFVLGWLFRMTHRIWPGLLVHMFVNSVAMVGLAVKIASGTP